jgi:hypothetical protein
MPIAFWSWQLVAALILNTFIQCLLIGAYAARMAGVLSGRVATSISLFNLFVTVSRMAALIYSPMLGSLSDHAAATAHVNRSLALANFEWQLRAVVFAGTIGAAVGVALLPAFVDLFLRGIASFERTRSVPKALLRLLAPRTVGSVFRAFRLPSHFSLRRFSLRTIPKDLLIFNVLVTAVYAIGTVAATYASVLNPGASRTALLSTGLVMGIATISYTLVVDPGSAYIVDQAVKGERSIAEVKSLVVWLSVTAITGMLLSQLLIVPAAEVVSAIARLVTGR